jgi:hypothetical protein
MINFNDKTNNPVARIQIALEVASRHILESQPRARAHDGYVRPMEFALQRVIAPG